MAVFNPACDAEEGLAYPAGRPSLATHLRNFRTTEPGHFAENDRPRHLSGFGCGALMQRSPAKSSVRIHSLFAREDARWP